MPLYNHKNDLYILLTNSTAQTNKKLKGRPYLKYLQCEYYFLLLALGIIRYVCSVLYLHFKLQGQNV